MRGGKEASIGYILPTLYTIKIEIEIDRATTEYANIICLKFSEIDETNKDLIVASVSHPKFKLSWFPDSEMHIVEQMFIETCLNLEPLNGKNNNSNEGECDSDCDDFFCEFWNSKS